MRNSRWSHKPQPPVYLACTASSIGSVTRNGCTWPSLKPHNDAKLTTKSFAREPYCQDHNNKSDIFDTKSHRSRIAEKRCMINSKQCAHFFLDVLQEKTGCGLFSFSFAFLGDQRFVMDI